MEASASKFASIKLTRAFVEWIKIEAAKARQPMYVFLEETFKRARRKSTRRG
jgi:hypothetical protein